MHTRESTNDGAFDGMEYDARCRRGEQRRSRVLGCFERRERRPGLPISVHGFEDQVSA